MVLSCFFQILSVNHPLFYNWFDTYVLIEMILKIFTGDFLDWNDFA